MRHLRAEKRKITNTPVQAYSDPEKELELQVDSSKDGLRAAILQDGRPTEFASKALTPAKQKWAQTEKKTLSLVLGLKHFDQHRYGRKVQVQNDHRPLATIPRKPLSQASCQIHALMMRLHKYDVTFKYVQGSQLFFVDTLSHAYLHNPEIDVHVVVRDAEEKDPALQALLQVSDEEWPAKKSDGPKPIRLYFEINNTLSYHDGIILRGDRILISFALRSEMKKRLHSSHLGYDSMLRRACELLYWLGINRPMT